MLRFIMAAMLGTLAAPANAAGLPAPLEAFAAENGRTCTAMGGTPRVGPAFATPVDLNGDGLLDFIVDLAGVECANAWSVFCGTSGCPVSVWITGANGPAKTWEQNALGWRIEGTAADIGIVVEQQGTACANDAVAETCTQRLAFDGPPPASEPPQAEAEVQDPTVVATPDGPPLPLVAPTSPGWSLRDVPDGTPVAASDGPGVFASLAAFCLGGQPWLAATFDAPQAAETAEITFAFSDTSVSAVAQREESAGGAFVIELASLPLAGLLAGRASTVQVSLDGAEQGELSLRGSTRAIRGALESCLQL